MSTAQPIAEMAGKRQIWAVGIGDLGECHCEADTAASARWCVASACHEAGYGHSPIDLIRRGCTVRRITETEAAIFLSRMYVAPRRASQSAAISPTTGVHKL